MIFNLFILLGMALFAVGISGILASRNFIIMMLSIEIMIISSTVVALSVFYFVSSGNIVILLLVIWSAASAEAMALVAFYRYMTKGQASLDVTKLSKLRN
jgi:NADH:ubiquinone oxidoreductase subunit K